MVTLITFVHRRWKRMILCQRSGRTTLKRQCDSLAAPSVTTTFANTRCSLRHCSRAVALAASGTFYCLTGCVCMSVAYSVESVAIHLHGFTPWALLSGAMQVESYLIKLVSLLVLRCFCSDWQPDWSEIKFKSTLLHGNNTLSVFFLKTCL